MQLEYYNPLTILGLACYVGLFLGTIFAYQMKYRLFVAWLDRGITIMRYRYCILLCLTPGALGVIAWFNPYMLSAILYLRTTGTQGAFDIVVITMISFFTVGVGLAEAKLIGLNGDQRFADRKKLLMDGHPPGDSNDEGGSSDETPGWSYDYFIKWYVLSLVMPVLCLWSSWNDGHLDAVVVLGAFGGIAGAMIVAWIVALFQSLLLGGVDGTASSGIMPFESYVVRFARNRPDADGTNTLFGKNGFFSKLIGGPGYTNPQGVLLPGQAQNIVLVIFVALVYCGYYLHGLGNSDWKELGWPTGFYAILLLFLIGFFMSGLAYWLDRFGLPPSIFAVLYVLGSFWLGASDHYFEVDVRPRRLQQHEDATDESNAFVVAGSGPALKETDLEQLYWAEVLEKWPFPNTKEPTLVVVTASGGGIQAAAWTAHVLTNLDKEIPGFSRSIGLISSVSGGSVGAMYYAGHRGPMNAPLTSEAGERIRNTAGTGSLEAVGWGLVFPDFVRAIAPPASPPLRDRGWALESWWWNAMGRKGKDDREIMREVTIRDLIPLVREKKIPPIVFNATCVETGQRVQISPLYIGVAPLKNYKTDWYPEWPVVYDQHNAKQEVRDELIAKESYSNFVATPIDFLDFYDVCLVGNRRNNPQAWNRSNIRISTAARLSATFSYVTPVARPCPVQDFGPIATLQRIYLDAASKVLPQHDSLTGRLDRHFCDGGYADNAGLVTAVHSLRDLLDYYAREKKDPPFKRVLIVRIEPFPATSASFARDNTGFMSAVYGPTAAMHATRVSTQAERGELELSLLQSRKDGPRVDSVTLQFKLRESERASQPKANSDEIVTPPLTWTLTECQKKDIDQAWIELKKKGRWTEKGGGMDSADTISPSEIEALFQ